jgi:ketosteroid isomerase-like protein
LGETNALKALLAIVAVLAAAPLHAHPADLERSFAEHIAAVQARDLKRLETTLTLGEQLELILPNGTRTATRAAYLEFHRSFFAEKTWTIAFQTLSQITSADLAVITTRSTYRDAENGKPIVSHSIVSFTFRREGGAWKLIHDQNTPLPAENAAP